MREERWGKPKRGKWDSVEILPCHVYLHIAALRCGAASDMWHTFSDGYYYLSMILEEYVMLILGYVI